MKRRTVFKHLAVASAAAWILPSCISDPKKVSIALNRLEITSDEEEMVGNIAEVIIPTTDTPGARAVGAHLFTLVMVDDCMSKDDQAKYLKGMRSFDNVMKSVTDKSFSDASPEERLQMLTTFEASLDQFDDETKVFYNRTRAYVLQGYTSSQYFLTKIKPYQLVPGPGYKGCVPVIGDQKILS